MEQMNRQRQRREQRVLLVVLAALLLATLAVSPLAFGQLWLLLLLAFPFALTLLVSVLVPPMVSDLRAERAELHEATSLKQARRLEAERHAVIAPIKPASLADDFGTLRTAMADAEAQYGIHFGCAALRDGEFLQAFHATELDPKQFRHGDHLRYTFLMLRRVPAGLVEETIGGNLRAFLRVACGSESLFHATQTHAWVALLQALPERTFSTALRTHAARLTGKEIERYYSPELLSSPTARQRVLAPDREPLPGLRQRAYTAPAAQAPIASST